MRMTHKQWILNGTTMIRVSWTYLPNFKQCTLWNVSDGGVITGGGQETTLNELKLLSGNCCCKELNLVQKPFNHSMYYHPAVMKVRHLNVLAWENGKYWRNSFGTAYVISVCSCANNFMEYCLHKSAVNVYWRFLNCGLSGAKPLSVPDVVCASLKKIRKFRQQDQSSNRCVPSDRQCAESSPTGRTSSGIVLLKASSLSGMNWCSVLWKSWLLSCWACGFECCKGQARPSLVSDMCCC